MKAPDAEKDLMLYEIKEKVEDLFRMEVVKSKGDEMDEK
jgi:hypothetical protein